MQWKHFHKFVELFGSLFIYVRHCGLSYPHALQNCESRIRRNRSVSDSLPLASLFARSRFGGSMMELWTSHRCRPGRFFWLRLVPQPMGPVYPEVRTKMRRRSCSRVRSRLSGLDPSGPATIMQRTQPEGVRSGPGDIDRTLHPLRRFLYLPRLEIRPCSCRCGLPSSRRLLKDLSCKD
jgi:hypothetical protein